MDDVWHYQCVPRGSRDVLETKGHGDLQENPATAEQKETRDKQAHREAKEAG